MAGRPAESSAVSNPVDTIGCRRSTGDDPERTDSRSTPRRAEAASPGNWIESVKRRLPRVVHPSAWCVLLGALIFAVVFGRLGVQHHRNFGTWSFDMGIYDQAFWLVSRGKSWITVRGIDVWGHHVNLIAFAFVPFYWLGAGPIVPLRVAGDRARRRGHPHVPDRLRPLEVDLAWRLLRLRLPDVRADPVDRLGQLPPRGVGDHADAVRLVVRHAPQLGLVLRRRGASLCRPVRTRRWRSS